MDIEGRYKLVSDGPIFADWFSGVLRIPKGEVLRYAHMGFATIYEQELLVKIEQGVVVATELVDNRGKDIPPSPPDTWGDVF